MNSEPVIATILMEQGQGFATRKPLLIELEKLLGRPIVSLFTSFKFPVMLDDDDADMLEGVLRKLDLSKGLALMISSPGGDGLAAERIINLCRSYSGTGEYWVLIPSKAKSAATMVCVGASKIIMGQASELGPVDPQLTFRDKDGRTKRFSVYNIVTSYEALFSQAVREKEGHIEPYLQQLNNYDEREIAELRSALALSEDIAVRSLKTGMMTEMSDSEIKGKIATFLTPEVTKVHGRPIYHKEASECGLRVEVKGTDETFWDVAYELYIRTNNYVKKRVTKCIESSKHSFCTPAPVRE